MASLVLPDEGEAYAQENSHPNLIIRASKQSATVLRVGARQPLITGSIRSSAANLGLGS
jgi:hypothetical protein